MIEAGFPRFTGDIDLLIDPDPENEARFSGAPNFAREGGDQLERGEIAKPTVVRIADEVVVDLLASSCGVNFEGAHKDVIYRTVAGVQVPFASPAALWQMKRKKNR